MNFDFSEEQLQFAAQVRRVLARVAPLSEARRVLEGEVEYSEAAWGALAALGFQGTAIPEEFGGLGLGSLELCVAAEEIGYALAPVPALSSTFVCCEAIRMFGSDEQKRFWLPRLAQGSVIGTWAAPEGGVESPEGRLRTVYRDGRLSGLKAPVLDGLVAELAVVLADDPRGEPVLVMATLRDREVRRRKIESVDPSRPVAEITFAGAHAERLGDAARAEWEILRNRAAVFLAFEQIGGADRALWMARDYALERKSFGRPIGSYQAIKHKLANVYAKNQLARSHAYYGAWALFTDAPELSLAAAGARAASTEAFSFSAQESLQTHGGIGFTWDADCQLFYRRARQQALVLGPVHVWKERILRHLSANEAR